MSLFPALLIPPSKVALGRAVGTDTGSAGTLVTAADDTAADDTAADDTAADDTASHVSGPAGE